MKFRLLLILQCAILLNACTSLTQLSQQQPEKYQTSESQSCARLFINTNEAITAAGVIDAEATRVLGYPYLRVNRFLSDFRNNHIENDKFNTWLDRMQSLAMEGWQIELSNFSASDREKLSLQANDISVSNMSLNETLNYCGNVLRAIDLDEENERQDLKIMANVPDEYKTWQRVIGLYPITALAFRSGIDHWHKEMNKIYAQPLETLPVYGELVHYAPSANSTQLSQQEISHIIKDSSNNALNIPELSASDRQKLFDSFAPIFEIDIVNNDDRIGTVEWDKDNIPVIRTDLSKVYQHLSYTRISDQILLQLNFTIWFPSRPKTSTFDIFGGHLDGITWRVTLLPDGRPWLFDTIHNCGCYHLFFPAPYTTILTQEPTLDEPVFIPQVLSNRSTERPFIRIAHGNHYIERVYFDNAASHKIVVYQLAESKKLRSLELKNGNRRSLYGQDGIVHSSKRGERFLFWPMGIPNPGAMRQWGHHATAFVGRRHFDDARLFENYFGIDAINKQQIINNE